MVTGEFKVWFEGPADRLEEWTIILRPIPRDGNGKTVYGYTDFAKRELTLNSNMRNEDTILETIVHEVAHATLGKNGSEEFAIDMEGNFKTLKAKLQKFTDAEIDP